MSTCASTPNTAPSYLAVVVDATVRAAYPPVPITCAGFGRPLWLCLLLALIFFPAAANAEVWREARPLMGTVVELQLEGPSPAPLRRAAAAAYAEMERLSAMLSHYDADSVVSRINRAAGGLPVAAPPELIEVLRLARQVSVTSDGAFDITIGSLTGWRFDPSDGAAPAADQLRPQLPLVNFRDVIVDPEAGTVFLPWPGMRIDLGGIAKLYILDAGMNVLRRAGVERALVNGGGDVLVAGGSRQRPWRIGIQHPRAPGRLLCRVELRDGFVVSSGDYERYFRRDGRRYHHILDPRTGYPARGLVHVTLLATRLEAVNGYSAAVMALGAERGWRLLRARGLQGLLAESSGRVQATADFAHCQNLR